MKTLVTGASGFIGSHLVERLHSAGHDLMVICRNHTDFPSNVQSLQADLSDPDCLAEHLEQFQPEAIYHLAWEGLPDYSEATCRKNVTLTMNFLARAVQVASVKKVVIAGSCWEYGDALGRCSEDQVTNAQNWFVWAKHTLQEYTKRICEEHDIHWYWARVFFVYGEGQRPQSLIPMIISALQGDKLPDVRSPYAKNDFVYVGDLADGLAKFLNSDIASGVYNFGSGTETMALDVLKTIESIMTGGTEKASHIENITPPPDVPPKSFFADTHKSTTLLGWSASTSLSEGIEHTLKAMDT